MTPKWFSRSFFVMTQLWLVQKSIVIWDLSDADIYTMYSRVYSLLHCVHTLNAYRDLNLWPWKLIESAMIICSYLTLIQCLTKILNFFLQEPKSDLSYQNVKTDDVLNFFEFPLCRNVVPVHAFIYHPTTKKVLWSFHKPKCVFGTGICKDLDFIS